MKKEKSYGEAYNDCVKMTSMPTSSSKTFTIVRTLYWFFENSDKFILDIKNGQRMPTDAEINSKGKEFLATTGHMGASCFDENIKGSLNKIKKMGIKINKSDIISTGGSPTMIEIAIVKVDGEWKFRIQNSGHRKKYTELFFNNKLPLPRKLGDEFSTVNRWLESLYDDFVACGGNDSGDALYFGNMSDELQEVFRNSPVYIKILDTDDENLIRELFHISNSYVNVSSKQRQHNSYANNPDYKLYDKLETFSWGAKAKGKNKLADVVNSDPALFDAIGERNFEFARKVFANSNIDSIRGEVKRLIYISKVKDAEDKIWEKDVASVLENGLITSHKNISDDECNTLIANMCELLYNGATLMFYKDQLEDVETIANKYCSRYTLLNAACYDYKIAELKSRKSAEALYADKHKKRLVTLRNQKCKIKENDTNCGGHITFSSKISSTYQNQGYIKDVWADIFKGVK